MTAPAVPISARGASPGFVLPLLAGAGTLAFLLLVGDSLLQDSDVFWQIETGRWILTHGAVPTADTFSFTKAGAAWLSSSWLAQVIFALATQAGWAGPVLVTALAAAAAVALLVGYLERFAPAPIAGTVALFAVVLIMPHLLTRPHVLALPLMLAWAITLLDAADRAAAPPAWLLLVMMAWANLHGGFVLGLMLLGAISLEALRRAAAPVRLRLALRWAAFGVGALVACCVTPYGWHTLLAAGKILSLGEVLSAIAEWAPADFSSFGAFEASLLALLGITLARGLTLPWPRLLLVLGLVHMALAHVRGIDSYALLVPLIVARPWSEQLGSSHPRADAKADVAPPLWAGAIALLAIVATAIAIAPRLDYRFEPKQMPEQALAAAERHGARRIFNAYEFGGYLISRGVPVFIDGRAELYGEAMVMDSFRAVAARDIGALDRLLADHRIDATLLPPHAPAAGLMDRRAGWRRLYADDIAVVHVRSGG